MAEGAKMEGASQGTAQQRPLTGERVKGRRKKAARLLKWLTYLFNAGAEKINNTQALGEGGG